MMKLVPMATEPEKASTMPMYLSSSMSMNLGTRATLLSPLVPKIRGKQSKQRKEGLIEVVRRDSRSDGRRSWRPADTHAIPPDARRLSGVPQIAGTAVYIFPNKRRIMA